MTVKYNAPDRARLVSSLGSLRAMSKRTLKLDQALKILSDEVDFLDLETNRQAQSKHSERFENKLLMLEKDVASLVTQVDNIHDQISDINYRLETKQPRRKWWWWS